MDDSADNKLRETAWRRKLTLEEEAELRAWLAAHPGQESDWETESALTAFLSGLPDAPVPSNFTARVVQAAGSTANRRRSFFGEWTWRSFLPKAAVACVVLMAGFGVYRQHEATRQRGELAHRVANVSDVAALSNPEVLKDFETVRHLDQTPIADDELLALLQ